MLSLRAKRKQFSLTPFESSRRKDFTEIKDFFCVLMRRACGSVQKSPVKVYVFIRSLVNVSMPLNFK